MPVSYGSGIYGAGLYGSPIEVLADPQFARIGVTLYAIGSDDPITIMRSDGVAVRGAEPIYPAGGIAFVWDYEATSGLEYRYSAVYPDTVEYQSEPITLELTDAHAIGVGAPAYNMDVLPDGLPSYARKQRSAAVTILGRQKPLTMTDARTSWEGSLKWVTKTDDEADALEALLETAPVLFVQYPDTRFGARYILVGDVDAAPLSGNRDESVYEWTLAYQEVDRPGGDTGGDPGVSYQAILDAFDTYTDADAAADTYLDMLTGLDL